MSHVDRQMDTELPKTVKSFRTPSKTHKIVDKSEIKKFYESNTVFF